MYVPRGHLEKLYLRAGLPMVLYTHRNVRAALLLRHLEDVLGDVLR